MDIVDELDKLIGEDKRFFLQVHSSVIKNAIAEIKRLRNTLEEIKRFGYEGGHGRGWTCARIADKALLPPTNEGE